MYDNLSVLIDKFLIDQCEYNVILFLFIYVLDIGSRVRGVRGWVRGLGSGHGVCPRID